MNVSFGKVVVGNPGTPVRLTANQADPTASLPVHAVLIQPARGNTGRIYIGNTQTFIRDSTGQIAWLPTPSTNVAPAFSETVSYAANAIQSNEFWIDADNAGDGVIGSAVVA